MDIHGSHEAFAMQEVEHTYTSPETRAAYRAGLSTAAAICDLEAAHYGEKTQRTRGISSALKRVGNRIWAFRDRIDVLDRPKTSDTDPADRGN
jgi:hypothetical protein